MPQTGSLAMVESPFWRRRTDGDADSRRCRPPASVGGERSPAGVSSATTITKRKGAAGGRLMRPQAKPTDLADPTIGDPGLAEDARTRVATHVPVVARGGLACDGSSPDRLASQR